LDEEEEPGSDDDKHDFGRRHSRYSPADEDRGEEDGYEDHEFHHEEVPEYDHDQEEEEREEVERDQAARDQQERELGASFSAGAAPRGTAGGGRALGSKAYSPEENFLIFKAVRDRGAWGARKDDPIWKDISLEVARKLGTGPRKPHQMHAHWVDLKSAMKSCMSALSALGVEPDWDEAEDSEDEVQEKKHAYFDALFDEITRRGVPAYKPKSWWSWELVCRLWRYTYQTVNAKSAQQGAEGALVSCRFNLLTFLNF
jgi:hypothetical protein